MVGRDMGVANIVAKKCEGANDWGPF